MGLFSRHRSQPKQPLGYSTDVHSHLLPGIDDGVESWEESLKILHQLQEWGFRKVVTTPHIIPDYYPNGPENILPLRDELRARVVEAGLTLTIEAAAEYYVDEQFMDLLQSGVDLLAFGEENYVLFETSYMNEPTFLAEAIFKLSSQGYRPLMAHPERYVYFQENPDHLATYQERVFFQVNTLSLIGYYSPVTKKLAKQLHKAGLIHMLGSDIHRPRQLEALERALNTKLYRQIREQGIQNLKLT